MNKTIGPVFLPLLAAAAGSGGDGKQEGGDRRKEVSSSDKKNWDGGHLHNHIIIGIMRQTSCCGGLSL